MDPLVVVLYLLILGMAWADGFFWSSALRSGQNQERTPYTFSLIAGHTISTICLFVSFSTVVLNKSVYVRFGPRGTVGAANLILCVILILLTVFRFRSQLIRRIFGASLFLMFFWLFLALAH